MESSKFNGKFLTDDIINDDALLIMTVICRTQ